MTEKWRPVVGWEDLYEVSNTGQVRSKDRYARGIHDSKRLLRGRVLKPGKCRSGHLYVNLRLDGRQSPTGIHRLVLAAFIGPCPEGMECCHNDGDPTNNDVANLRWDTRSGNVQDAIRHGTHGQTKKTHCPKGHPFAGDNLRIEGRRRKCITCARANSLRYWHNKKKAA